MTDPLSITASAAGLVSLGLTVCSGLLEYYSAWKDQPSDVSTMCQSLEALGKILKVLEQKVQHPLLDRESVDRVTESIVSCAASIQILDSKLKKIRETKPGIGLHLQRAQYPFQRKTLEKLQRIISDVRSNLNIAATTLHLTVSIHSLNHLDLINKDVKEIIRGQEIERARALNAEERRLIDWLSPLDVTSKHIYARGRAQEGTGQWLLESVEFHTWLEAGGKVLWCPGMPGAGKTIQASTVIDFLERDCQQDKIGLAYIYFVYNDACQTLVNLLGSLLQQLARQSATLLKEIKSCYERCTENRIHPTVEEISRLLCLQVEKFDKVSIVLDALDECPEADKTREKLLFKIRGLLPVANLMVTSRPLLSIESTFKNDLRLEIRAQEQDVQKFIESQMDQEPNLVALLRGHDVVRCSITTTIVGRINGMFLIAVLHMNSLAKEDNIRDLKESLKRLPEDLDKTYDDALERIKNQDSRKVARAEQVLKLINCAKRPLKLEEMQQAVSIREGDTVLDTDALPGAEFLISTCCGLVVVEDESRIVRLVHYTVEEYFARKVERYRNPEAHAFFACILLTYLSFTKFEKWSLKDAKDEEIKTRGKDLLRYDLDREVITRFLGDNLLVRYGAENLGFHAREAFANHAHGSNPCFTTTSLQNNKSDKLWTLNKLMLDFLKKQDSLIQVAQYLSYTDRKRVKIEWPTFFGAPTNVTSLHMAASFGIQHLVESYLTQGANIDAKDSWGNTALHKASQNGHVGIVQVLLDFGATVSLRDASGRDALLWAVSENRLTVVHLLLQNGADPDGFDRFQHSTYYYAAIYGYEEMLEVLAGCETDISRLNKHMASALYQAVTSQHEGVIRFLIRGAKTWKNSKQHLSNAMGLTAVSCVGVGVMQILFEAGADVNSGYRDVGDSQQDLGISWYSNLSLHRAVQGRNLNGVSFLLAKGADVNALDHGGDSALVHACRSRYWDTSVFDLSIVHRRSRYWDTFVFDIRIVHQLLDNGADPAIADSKFGRIPLEWAVTMGNEELARVLLHYEHYSADKKSLMLYLTLIYYSILRESGEDVDRLLCQKQVEELGTISKFLLIYIPAERGYERVVRKFLESGASLNVEDPLGMTALHLAVQEGHVAIVELLLAKKANINLGDGTEDVTPLMIAARVGNMDLVKLLLRHGADIGAFSKACFYGCSALAQAIGQGHIATARFLLEKGANPNGQFRGSDRSTLFHHVARDWLEYGKYDSRRTRPEDQHPRVFALLRGIQRSTIDILLEHGADQEARDDEDRTPLAVAVEWSKLEAAQVLANRGANLEAKDKFGFTPLELAVRRGNLEVLQFLLDKGANPHSFSPGRICRIGFVSEDDFRSAVKLVLKAQSKALATSIEQTVQETPTRQETGPLPTLTPDRDTASEILDREDWNAGDSVANRRNSL